MIVLRTYKEKVSAGCVAFVLCCCVECCMWLSMYVKRDNCKGGKKIKKMGNERKRRKVNCKRVECCMWLSVYVNRYYCKGGKKRDMKGKGGK